MAAEQPLTDEDLILVQTLLTDCLDCWDYTGDNKVTGPANMPPGPWSAADIEDWDQFPEVDIAEDEAEAEAVDAPTFGHYHPDIDWR
eukprot:7182804-Heterocapsa_arctica.AAC.1